jgi:tetratricopeptide (TPR) repeat protein
VGRTLRFVVLLVVACVCAASSISSAADVTGRRLVTQRDRVAERLTQYGDGDFEGALQALLGGRSVRSVLGEFRRGAGAWIDQAPASEKARRAAVVAALSAELMAATFEQSWDDYRSTRDLVEWACSRVREYPPTQTERWFYLTTIALAQGARDDSFLNGVKRLITESLPTSGAHAEHAASRFPQEGRFKLAFVTTAWEAQFIATFPLPPNYLFQTLYFRFSTESGDATGSIRKTLQGLALLFDDPGVGAEARLRSGVLKFVLSDVAAARFDLQRAEAAKDDGVRYLTHVMLGAMADQAGNSQEALRRFRLAYDIVPASAASVALAGRLYRSGAEDEAREILRRFERQPPPADSWELYGQRDFRFVTTYRAEMRRSLGR